MGQKVAFIGFSVSLHFVKVLPKKRPDPWTEKRKIEKTSNIATFINEVVLCQTTVAILFMD